MPKILLVFIILFQFNLLYSQKDSPKFSESSIKQDENLKIFYDCQYCDVTFIKQNLGQVEFMRDRKFAEVHVLITSQRNGSGGDQFMIQFIGIGKMSKFSDTLKYSTDPTMTNDETRRLQLKYIELGLMRFLLEKGLGDEINLSFNSSKQEEAIDVKDPWKNWVFRLSANGWFNGQETSNNSNMNGSFSARRVTEKNKFNLWSNLSQNRSKYSFGGEEIITFQQNMNLYMSDVFSLNKHLSTGIFSDVQNSIYSNYNLSTGIRAAIEYDLFPYSESATKQAVVYYTIGPRYNDYIDTTLYNKSTELVFEHSILVGTSINQNWGNIRASVKYQNYLHDFELNSISFDLNLNVRIFKGFSWQINGRYSIQHNQINIVKPSGQSEIDLLLSQKQFKSGFNYWFSTGISYSFGSIYNTVVNPRLDF